MPETAVNDLPTGEDSGRPNAPDLSYSSGEWKNKRRAITSESQGIAVCERVFHDADESIRTVAKIREKSDGVAPPFSSKALMEEGAKHRSNMPTGFMESIMGKVGPRLYSHVTGARYLYTAELPAYDPETGEQILNRVEKTEKLREVTTRVAQEWSKWYLWLVQFTEEVSRHGYCFVAWLDDIEWRPLLFRLDQGQVPFGTEIMDSNIPFFVAKDSYSVDQLFGKIRDREIAEEEGW